MYTAEINRNDPSCFLFLIDQSGSMTDTIPDGRTKAEFLAKVLNMTLAEIVTRCTKADGVRDYFDIGVIAYGDRQVRNGFSGALSGGSLHPVSRLADNPIRVEKDELTRKKQIYPVWFEPASAGSTPMKQAFHRACSLIQQWCDSHEDSYPPTVIHVSDGESTDGDPTDEAEILAQMHTDDGSCLVYNLHIDTGQGNEIVFPFSDANLPGEHAELLYSISSVFPAHLIERARQRGYAVNDNSRFFIYNGSMEFIVNFFDIGTRPANLR